MVEYIITPLLGSIIGYVTNNRLKRLCCNGVNIEPGMEAQVVISQLYGGVHVIDGMILQDGLTL